MSDDLEADLLEHQRNYEKESVRLLKTIAEREEMVKLLKIARPEKIADIRECISRLDKSIERTEHIMEININLIEQTEILIQDCIELSEMTDIMEKELIEHIKQNEPEKLEILEAILSDDQNSH